MGRAAHRVPIHIGQSEILFPQGYYFSVSPLHDRKKLLATEIQEVSLNTQPPSLLTKEKEIIFLKNRLRHNLELFARLNRIPRVERLDVWEHLNRPFLDTTFDENEKRGSLRKLHAVGFSAKELRQIRKRITPTMIKNMVVWEYQYLGLFDYLNWTFLSKEKYRWAMEIALRAPGQGRASFVLKNQKPSKKK